MGGFTIGLFFTGASAYVTTCCPPSVLAPGSSTSGGIPTGTVLKPVYICILDYFALRMYCGDCRFIIEVWTGFDVLKVILQVWEIAWSMGREPLEITSF
jgi:hypothetical protein